MSRSITRRAQSNLDKIVKPAPLVDSIYDIYANEISKLSIKSRGAGLEPADFKALQSITSGICQIRKDERDQHKAESLNSALETMSKEELLEVVQAELKAAEGRE